MPKPHLKETRIIFTMTLLLFVLAVAYCILRSLKDAVTLTGTPSGAEILPFIKVWGMLPASILFATLVTWLSRHMNTTRLFYVMISGFLGYYLIFTFLLYPNKEALELVSIGNWLQAILPTGSKGLVHMIRHWPITTFYVMSEMWATTMINVLFWGFTNERISPEMAKRFYGKIKIGATLSALGGGFLASVVTMKAYNPFLPYGSTTWEQTLVNETGCVVLLGLIGIGLFAWVSRQLTEEFSDSKPKKVQMRLSKAIRYVSGSRYLICLALAVVGYNLAFNLSDVIWKQQVRLAFPDPNDIMTYMNKMMMWIGLLSFFGALASGPIVRRIGWTTLGGLTPLTILMTFLGFFLTWLWSFPLPLILSAGALNNCLSKAAKYSVFDISKELAFTPLDNETKWNGKAAIDGIGNEVGKTGASLMHQGLLLGFGSMAASFPYVAGIILAVLFLWIGAVQYLGKQYEEYTETHSKFGISLCQKPNFE